MKIYKISQSENIGYVAYSSAVVIASGVFEAKRIIPGYYYREDEAPGQRFIKTKSWASSEKYVDVEFIGHANKLYNRPCIICSSLGGG